MNRDRYLYQGFVGGAYRHKEPWRRPWRSGGKRWYANRVRILILTLALVLASCVGTLGGAFIRDPAEGGCSLGAPPARLGFRLVAEES